MRHTIAKKAAFEEACIAHLDDLYNAALRLTRSSQEAEELVQDTMVRALRFRRRFSWGTNLKAWLFRIMTNLFINDYRHRQHHYRFLERAEGESLYDNVLDTHAQRYAANPENHVFQKFFAHELDKALERLPVEFRTVVVLADVEGFSYKEIADIIDAPMGTVMSRLHRARRLLQQALFDYAVDAEVVKPDASTTASLAAYRKKKEASS